jgi:hypothetical protein
LGVFLVLFFCDNGYVGSHIRNHKCGRELKVYGFLIDIVRGVDYADGSRYVFYTLLDVPRKLASLRHARMFDTNCFGLYQIQKERNKKNDV